MQNSPVIQGIVIGATLWSVAVPIIRCGCQTVVNKSASLSTSMSLWIAGIAVSCVTDRSLAYAGVTPKNKMIVLTTGTIVANLIDGIVFSYFPHFYHENTENTVRASGHILWTTSWGLLFGLLGVAQ
jgi:hypothetical protein